MLKSKAALSGLVIISALALNATAQDAPKPAAPGTNMTLVIPAMPPREHQGDVASKTATFGTVAATDDAYKSALDAHSLDDALKLVDKDGAFKGTVAKVFEPRGLAIVEFDQKYRTALTAIVHGSNFASFPPLTNLIGSNVVVTGKFIKFREAAEIVLEKPEQIKVVK